MKSEEKPPEPLFLEFSISNVLDSNRRIPRAEPWASQYCTAISEERYGDAIYARYHFDGRAKDGIYTDVRDDSCETYQISVFDLIMKDAKEFARDCPDLYQMALKLYSTTSPNDAHLDIIEGLNRTNVGFRPVSSACFY